MATSISARLSTKYQLVIPREVREALKLQPNDSVIFLIVGDSVYMRPRPKSFTSALTGLHSEVWSANTDEWLEVERASWQ
jgi:AbrB family looped-hinge helix DNA binding protein